MRKSRAGGLLALALALAPAAAWAQAPHAHGVAKLDVALEGGRLTLEFTAPLEDIVGFERRPANDRERAVLDAAASYFKSGRALATSVAAGCRVAEAGVVLDVVGEGHLEFGARLSYDCRQPQALRGIEAALLGQYGKVKRIDVRAVTPKGQSSGRLVSGKRTFGF
jgi:hypothetical protein